MNGWMDRQTDGIDRHRQTDIQEDRQINCPSLCPPQGKPLLCLEGCEIPLPALTA